MTDSTCVFCKIVAGQIPAHKVYEDANFLAFLDIRPLSPGHTLVIPKIHHRWVWDVTDPATYFTIVQKIAKAQQKAFGTDAIFSKVIGNEVPHAHVWIFPDPEAAQGMKEDFAENTEKIRAELS